jgi:hypothetical protein
VACEFKRADFLEGEAIETSLRIGTEIVQSESGLCTALSAAFLRCEGLATKPAIQGNLPALSALAVRQWRKTGSPVFVGEACFRASEGLRWNYRFPSRP